MPAFVYGNFFPSTIGILLTLLLLGLACCGEGDGDSLLLRLAALHLALDIRRDNLL